MTDTNSTARGDDPGLRGRLEVGGRVAERIAGVAAQEVPGVVRSGSALEGVVGRRYPKVTADIAGQHVRVALEVAVEWPVPLATTAQSVRDQVRARLRELAGLDVDAVHVTVAQVVKAGPPAERRVE